MFTLHQAFTNDEGAYLYDAKTLADGRLPGGDILVKSPAAILFFSGAVAVTHNSLFAARIVNVLASLCAAWPLFFLVKIYVGKRAAYFALLLWLLGSGPIIFYSFGHTQALASLWSLSAIAFVVVALQRRRFAIEYILASGICFALAFASRKIEIITLVPIVYLFLKSEMDRVTKLRLGIVWLVGCMSVFSLWFLFVFRLYGVIGVEQAIGFGYGSLIQQHANATFSQPWWGADRVSVVLVIMRVALLNIVVGLAALAYTFVEIIKSYKRKNQSLMVMPLLWLVVGIVLYVCWPGFLPDYIADLFPALTLVSAIFLSRVTLKISQFSRTFLYILLVLVNIYSLTNDYYHPWTGMFTAKAVTEAAHILSETVPINEPIFTAAVIIPYLSGHQAFADISHPLWYTYPFISNQILQTFLPPLIEVEDAIVAKKVHWAIVEHLTDYAYLRSSTDLLNIIQNNWLVEKQVTNNTNFRSNPISILKAE